MEPGDSPRAGLHWPWILGGAVLGALLIAMLLSVVDPGLERLELSALVVAMTLVLVGVVIGRGSGGETVEEAAVSALLILAAVFGYLVFIQGTPIPGFVWVVAPFFGPAVAMFGGWVGEMLQGSLPEAHTDEALDWPWVFVAVVCGFLLNAYGILLASAFFELGDSQLLASLLISVLLTGWLVGFFSPGLTLVEPAVASLGVLALSGALAELWLEQTPPFSWIALAIVGGLVIGTAGGFIGEAMQGGSRALAVRRIVRGY